MGKSKISASDAELRRMYCELGMRQREIAERFGCSVAAVSIRLNAAGVTCRKLCDYPATEKMRAAWAENGRRAKGRKLTDEQRMAISVRNKGKRKRTDYEFGGHEKKRSDGYIKVYAPDHPKCTADGYMMKHILVMEKMIGRHLRDNECVHHINHIRDDNRLENLRLMTKSEHMSMHMKERHENRRMSQC